MALLFSASASNLFPRCCHCARCPPAEPPLLTRTSSSPSEAAGRWGQQTKIEWGMNRKNRLVRVRRRVSLWRCWFRRRGVHLLQALTLYIAVAAFTSGASTKTAVRLNSISGCSPVNQQVSPFTEMMHYGKVAGRCRGRTTTPADSEIDRGSNYKGVSSPTLSFKKIPKDLKRASRAHNCKCFEKKNYSWLQGKPTGWWQYSSNLSVRCENLKERVGSCSHFQPQGVNFCRAEGFSLCSETVSSCILNGWCH